MIKKYINKYKKSLVICGAVFMVGSLLLGGYVWHWEVRPHILEIHVTPADTVLSVFVRTPDNRTILVDGGKTGAIMRTLTSLMPFYRRNIDTVILTKNDDTHAAGLVDVLNRYHVGQVIEMANVFTGLDGSAHLAKIMSTSTAYLEFEKIITKKNIVDKKLSMGDDLSFEDGAYGLVAGSVIFPPRPSIGTSTPFKFSKTNLPQLAMRIGYGATSFVIGDLSKTEQKYIASSSAPADVLIFQHAGGASAMNENFFNAIHPDYAVISKKPTVSKATVPVLATSSTKKPKKPPFSIVNVSATQIINLATDGPVEFISDGKIVRYRK